jgi:flagellin-like hook-associated protein FlgL
MLISPVPATPVAPVQSSRPSPVPVQGVASVEPVSPVADANEQLSRELDEALHAMDNLRSQLAASQARLSAASRSVAQQARQAAPPPDGGDTDLGTGSRRYVAQSALTQARQAQHSALSVSA